MKKKEKLTVKYDKLSKKGILQLMKQGLTVTFPTGYYLQGIVGPGYIQVGHDFGFDGLWNLTLEGVADAINDAKKYELDQIKNADTVF